MSVIFPENKYSRCTMYFDESGIPSFKNVNQKYNRYFIFTGLLGNNFDFERLEAYYYRLKKKYFNHNILVHSAELFKNNSSKTKLYIKELASFIANIPFYPITVVVDKKKAYSKAEFTTPTDPFSSTLHLIKSVWSTNSHAGENFKDVTIEQALKLMRAYKFKNINNIYPLQKAFKEILAQYTHKTKRYLFDNHSPQLELCFETSPYRFEIIEMIDRYTQFKNLTDSDEKELGVGLNACLFNVSFPNKNARFMGLELADLISYGYYLKTNRLLSKVPAYKPIWKILRSREKEFERVKKLECAKKV